MINTEIGSGSDLYFMNSGPDLLTITRTNYINYTKLHDRWTKLLLASITHSNTEINSLFFCVN